MNTYKHTNNKYKGAYPLSQDRKVLQPKTKLTNWYEHENYTRVQILLSANKKLTVNTTGQQSLLSKAINVHTKLAEKQDEHPHFFLGLLRKIFEEHVTLQNTMIYDIGCGARSLAKGLLNVHNNRPIITSADKERNSKLYEKLNTIPAKFVQKYRDLICHCKVGLETCPHIDKLLERQQVTLLSVDSSYYPGVMKFIAENLKKDNCQGCYAVFHVFNPDVLKSDIMVDGNHEGSYEIKDNIVYFESKGNAYKYIHPLHMMNELYFTNAAEISIEGVTLQACVQRRMMFQNNHYILVRIDTATVEDEVVATAYLGYKPATIKKQQVTGVKRALPQITEKFSGHDLSNGSYLRIEDNGKFLMFKQVGGQIKSAQVYIKEKGYLWDDEYTIHVTEELNYKDLISVDKLNRLVNQFIVKKEINRQLIAEAISKILLQDSYDVTHVIAIVENALKTTLQVLIAADQLKNSETVSTFNAIKNETVLIKDLVEEEKKPLWQEIIDAGINLISTPFTVAEDLLNLNNNDHLQANLLPIYNSNESFYSANDFDAEFQELQNKIQKLCEDTYVNQPRSIGNSCISADNFKDVSNELDLDTKWKLKLPELPSIDEFLSFKCLDENKKEGLVQILPTIEGAPEPIIYENCLANAFCAIKRQATQTPYPDETMLKKFEKFVDRIIETELKTALTNFSYSYEEWYNHLTTSQQKEIDKLDKNNIQLSDKWDMFCKREKQLYEKNGKAPKNRCICSPGPEHKFVLGPVTYALEKLMKENLKGYCGGKNWDDLEDYYNEMHDRGLTLTCQLDGSGFDRTQHQSIKNLVDHKIYQFVQCKITHCTEEEFNFYAFITKRKVSLYTREKIGKCNKFHRYGHIIQDGKVFSGAMDTTLMNTVRMALYNRFVIEEIYGLFPNQYGLLCKGDDSAGFFPRELNQTRMEECYLQVFTKDIRGVHGLGQTAKYLKWGDIEDIDFCSTETFYAKSINSYKITRKLDRFLTLTAWSRKACKLNDTELKMYLKCQYYSNLCWMRGLPIYRVYNQAFNVNTNGLKIVSKNGEIKSHITEDNYEEFALQFQDKDDLYKLERKSKKIASPEDYFDFLERRYNLSRSEVLQAEQDIYTALISKSGVIRSEPLLKLISE